MKYIVFRRFKGRAICGDVNLPAFTQCVMENGMIRIGEAEICVATSENAHSYFSVDEDGFGMERGTLTRRIIKRLSKNDDRYQDRWDRVWRDQVSLKYRRTNHDDFWIWSHDFYNAPISDLRHIAEIIGA